MANDREIVIKISADGTAAIAGIRNVSDSTERFGNQTSGIAASIKRNWLEITAGITGTYLAFQQIWGLMDKAAEHAEKMEVLDALTRRYGTTAQGLVGVIEENSHGLIGVGAAANVAADALAKGFSPQQVAQMANVAAVMHKTSSEGMSASEAFKSLEGSITAARERGVVKMMGATIDLASSLGAQYNAMSKAEKAQTMLNAVTERAAKVERALGDEYDSAADRMQRFNNSIERMKLFFGDLILIIGQPFMAVFQVAMMMVYGLAGAFDTLVTAGAMVTDWLKITEGATERWAKKADTAYKNAARSATDAFENIKGAWASIGDIGSARGTGEALGGDTGTNVKRAEQLAEVMRKIREAQTLAEASEIDKSRIQNDIWFNEQVKKLHDLGASDKEYSVLVAAYAAKRHADITSWANKTSEFYLAVQRDNAKEADQIEKDRIAASYKANEQSAKDRLEIEDIYAEMYGESESGTIARRANAEREVMEIRRRGLLDSITEQTSFEEKLKIMWQVRDVQNEIEASKRREAAESDRAALKRDADRQIQIFNDGLGKQLLLLDETTAKVSAYSKLWNYAHTTMIGYEAQLYEAGMNTFRGMEDAITNFVMTGKMQFRDFANSVIADLIRIAVRASITAPLANGLMGLLSSSTPSAFDSYGVGSGMGTGGYAVNLPGRASGGPVSAGMSYWVGERGIEMFTPSVAGTITPNGGKGNVTVNIRNEGGQKMEAKSSRASFDAQGWVIDVVLDGLKRDVHGLRTAFGGA